MKVAPVPSISFGWIWILILAVWFLPLVSRSSCRTSTDPENKTESEKSAYEFIAQRHGDYRSDAEIRKGNALIHAVLAEDVAKVRKLLAAGTDVNARFVDVCKTGYTALMYACESDNEILVELLLAHGADVHLERAGANAMHFAFPGGNRQIFNLLEAAGARYDAKQLWHTHLLIRAACKGFIVRKGEEHPRFPGAFIGNDSDPTHKELLAQGADVNAADPRGLTPLMYAANLGLLDNVKVLVANGADPRKIAHDGITALSLSERPEPNGNREGRRQVADYLRKIMAE